MRFIDFSTWQGVLTTLAGLAMFTLIGVGIRVLMMLTIQQRQQRMNRQINERLKTLIAAYKVLGGSFTGRLSVDPSHMGPRRRNEASEIPPALQGAEAGAVLVAALVSGGYEAAAPAEAASGDETSAQAETAAPAQRAAPAATARPIEASISDKTAAPTETAGPIETTAPVEAAAAAETSEVTSAAPITAPDSKPAGQAGSQAETAVDQAEAPQSPPSFILERRTQIRDAVEAALADILLLGTEEQVRLAGRAAADLAEGRVIQTAELVVALRDYIRKALDLEPIPEGLTIPAQGPTRPSSGGRGAGRPGGAGGGGGGGGMGGGGMGGGGMGMGMGMGLGAGRNAADGS